MESYLLQERVRGTELDIVQFEVLTALPIRQVLGTFEQSQEASIAFIMSVCLSDRKYKSGSHWTDLREICLRVFMKMY